AGPPYTSTTCSAGRTNADCLTTPIRTSVRCCGPSEGMPSMTELATAKTMPADHAYWTERLGARALDAGPPLFRRRSGVYRRKSLQVEQTIPVEIATVLADADPRRQHVLFLAA